jgi:hypothetical protein
MRGSRGIKEVFLTLLIAPLLIPLTASGKCGVNFISIRGNVEGAVTPEMEVRAALVFKNDRNHPEIKILSIKEGSFDESVQFFTFSRGGHFGGLFGEWGEKCNRVPEKVVLRLVSQSGMEIDKVTLIVRKDFDLDPRRGFALRSPIVLHNKS